MKIKIDNKANWQHIVSVVCYVYGEPAYKVKKWSKKLIRDCFEIYEKAGLEQSNFIIYKLT